MNNKVLVTGADGFIGSHLTEILLEKGYRVKALAYYNSFNDWGWLEGLCSIGINPYYLVQSAHQYGYSPEIILAGRRMKNSMPSSWL